MLQASSFCQQVARRETGKGRIAKPVRLTGGASRRLLMQPKERQLCKCWDHRKMTLSRFTKCWEAASNYSCTHLYKPIYKMTAKASKGFILQPALQLKLHVTHLPTHPVKGSALLSSSKDTRSEQKEKEQTLIFGILMKSNVGKNISKSVPILICKDINEEALK